MALVDQIANLYGNIQADQAQRQQMELAQRRQGYLEQKAAQDALLNEQTLQMNAIKLKEHEDSLNRDQAYTDLISSPDFRTLPPLEQVKAIYPIDPKRAKGAAEMFNSMYTMDSKQHEQMLKGLEYKAYQLAGINELEDLDQAAAQYNQVTGTNEANPQNVKILIKKGIAESGAVSDVLKNTMGISSKSRKPIIQDVGEYKRIWNEETGQWDYTYTEEGRRAKSGVQLRHEEKEERMWTNMSMKQQAAEAKKGKFKLEFAEKLNRRAASVTKVANLMNESVEQALSIVESGDVGGLNAKLLQRSLAFINEANTRAKSEIDEWKPGTTGDVVTRLLSKVENFILGDYSTEEVATFKRQLEDLKNNYITESYTRSIEPIINLTEAAEIPLEQVISTDKIQMLNEVPTEDTKTPAAAEGEIVLKDPRTNKYHAYDAKTKEYLREVK